MSSHRVDSFKQLLNEISHELTERNLQSLIHLSNVPGAARSAIKDGLALFDYLIKEGKVSRDDLAYLRNLLRKMRPRQRKLVELVDNYIKREYNVKDVGEVLGELSNSIEEKDEHGVTARPFSGSNIREVDDPEDLFHFDCAYMSCVCRRFPSCHVPLIIFLIVGVIATIIFWYADVPKVNKHINSDEDLKKAGPYIILAECLLLLVILGHYQRTKHPCCRHGYGNFNNTTVQDPATPTTNPSYSAAPGERRFGSEPRVYKQSVSNGSCTGSAMSGYNSLDSVFSSDLTT